MQWRSLLPPLCLLVAVSVGAAGAVLTRDLWANWLPASAEQTKTDDHHHEEKSDQVILTPQAQRNLRLKLAAVELTTWQRKLTFPAAVVDWPGRTECTISAPLTGVVTHLLAEPGKSVRPGEPLFQLRLISEHLQNSQLEYFKTTRELELLQRQRERLEPTVTAGGMAPNKLLELDQQRDRLLAHLQAYEQDLRARRLSNEQINDIKQGKFLTAVVVRVPGPGSELTLLSGSEAQEPTAPPTAPERKHPSEYLVRELKVQAGTFVQAGQALATLADPRWLYIEGQAFKQEVDLITRAIQQRGTVELDCGSGYSSATHPLCIEFLGPTTGPGQLVPFYIPLPVNNTSRFRPGQRLQVRVPVEEFKNVLVVPRTAVGREGPEACVFLPNGKVLDRVPVQILHEDEREVVLANDGSVTPGSIVVQNEAAALLRVLRTRAGGGEDEHHHHHH